MRKLVEKLSGKASKSQPENSVYDFLYQDVRRVGSFLSQFEKHGFRQQVKATESTAATETSKNVLLGSVGLPAVVGASGTNDTTTAEETKDIAEHTFDPLWSNSRRLLDLLESNDLIKRNIYETQVGQICLVSGSISVVDTGLVHSLTKDPKVKEAYIAQSLVAEGIEPGSEKDIAVRNDFDFLLQLPSIVQIYIFGDTARVWSTLSHESLVTSTTDLNVKHGAMLRGIWTVLGVLDAIPDAKPDPTEEYPNPKTLGELAQEMITAPMPNIAIRMANVTRISMGRPLDCFGITPLLIFREVSG